MLRLKKRRRSFVDKGNYIDAISLEKITDGILVKKSRRRGCHWISHNSFIRVVIMQFSAAFKYNKHSTQSRYGKVWIKMPFIFYTGTDPIWVKINITSFIKNKFLKIKADAEFIRQANILASYMKNGLWIDCISYNCVGRVFKDDFVKSVDGVKCMGYCELCKTDWCFRCNTRKHDMSCADFKTITDKGSDPELKKIMTFAIKEELAKTCPGCGLFTIRSYACRKITCCCGTYWCFGCGAELLMNNYDHFSSTGCGIFPKNPEVEIDWELICKKYYT